MWVLREGVEAIPGIGRGPLTEEQMTAAEEAYLAAHYGEGVTVPADAKRPTDTGGYVWIEPEAATAAESQPPAAPQRAGRTKEK